MYMFSLVEVLHYKPQFVGSIPDRVTGFFIWLDPSNHPMALGSTRPLTEMSTWDICCGAKVANL